MPEDCMNILTDLISKNFLELDSSIVAALSENDEQYAQLTGQRKDIVSRFSEIDGWLEGVGPLTLTAEERAGLVEYMEITLQMENIERQALYYAGHRDCFLYLKKIGAV